MTGVLLMQVCTMDYKKLSRDGKTLPLECYGIGSFDVFK